MRIVTNIVLLIFFFHLTPVFSAENDISKPQEFFVGSADYDKIIKFKCTNGSSEDEVICNAILVSIDSKARFEDGFFSADEKGPDESLLKEFQKVFKGDQFLNEENIGGRGKHGTDGQKQYLSDLSFAIKNIQSAAGYKELKKAFKEFRDIQLNTCQVGVFSHGPYIFKYAENKKWTSITKAYKYCNVDLIQELTPFGRSGDTWDLVQTYTEPQNNDDPSCKKDYSRHQNIYTAEPATYITDPKCKYIELR